MKLTKLEKYYNKVIKYTIDLLLDGDITNRVYFCKGEKYSYYTNGYMIMAVENCHCDITEITTTQKYFKDTPSLKSNIETAQYNYKEKLTLTNNIVTNGKIQLNVFTTNNGLQIYVNKNT